MPFVKGDPRINRTGIRRGPSEKEQLIDALKKEGETRGEDFFKKVAKTAYDDKAVMVAVLKKILPDMSSTEHSGSVEFTEMPTVKVGGLPLELHIGNGN